MVKTASVAVETPILAGLRIGLARSGLHAPLFVQNADVPTRRSEIMSLEPGRVVLGAALQRDKQHLAAGSGHANADCRRDSPNSMASPIERGSRRIQRSVATRTTMARPASNSSTAPSNSVWSRGRAMARSSPLARVVARKPAPRQIGAVGILTTSTGAVMLKAMNFLGERGFQAAAHNMINAQHRAGSFQRWGFHNVAAPLVIGIQDSSQHSCFSFLPEKWAGPAEGRPNDPHGFTAATSAPRALAMA